LILNSSIFESFCSSFKFAYKYLRPIELCVNLEFKVVRIIILEFYHKGEDKTEQVKKKGEVTCSV
jgi:hypothetical protein